MAVPIRTRCEIDGIERAAVAAHAVLEHVLTACVPGVRSSDLEPIAKAKIAGFGAEAVFEGITLGDAGPFGHAVCVSVQEELAHCRPSDRILRDGDIVSVDCGVRLDGWCADVARSAVVGSRGRREVELCRRSLELVALAPSLLRSGRRWTDVLADIDRWVAEAGLALVRTLAAHGIGREVHEPPRLRLDPGELGPAGDVILRPGMVVTFEPVLTYGSGSLVPCTDGWGLIASDGMPGCHEERMVAIGRRRSRVLGHQPTA